MEKKKETKIKKIVLTIEGKDLVVSVETAKTLRSMLDDMFGKIEYRDRWYYNGWPSFYGGAINGKFGGNVNQMFGDAKLKYNELVSYCANANDVGLKLIGDDC